MTTSNDKPFVKYGWQVADEVQSFVGNSADIQFVEYSAYEKLQAQFKIADSYSRAYEKQNKELKSQLDDCHKLLGKSEGEPDNLREQLTLRIGDYYISRYHVGSYWICKDDGEGMQTSYSFEHLIDKFFKENM